MEGPFSAPVFLWINNILEEYIYGLSPGVLITAMSKIGIDIGGTFTDLLEIDESGGLQSNKAFTTDPEFEVGITNVLEKTDLSGEGVSEVYHGTTVATNAVIERSGMNVGLLYTDGFRDLMDMGRGVRPVEAGVDPFYQRPHEIDPLVPRYLRRPVKERVLEDGTVLFDIEENIDDLREEIDYLVEQGVDAIAVCLLHGYKHPEHERQVKEVVKEMYPDVPCYISSDICPYPREYDRTSTTVLNGYTAPIMTDYLDRYRDAINQFAEIENAAMWYMSNSGGMRTYDDIKQRPILTFDCGPVAGTMGVQNYGELLDEDNLIGFDMGGTTCDVSMIRNGKPLIANEHEIEFDIISALPSVEIKAIGSGGGSIATIDPAGGVSVGPESAGSDPGPACFGRGGEEPTLTDAVTALGYLSPDVPLADEVAVDVDLAREVLSDFADTLDVETERAARMVYEVAGSDMAGALREMTIYQGIDPEEFTLVAYGAAGPLLAPKVASELQIPDVVVPRFAGVFSAYGLTTTDVSYESVEPIQHLLNDVEAEDLKETFQSLREECVSVLQDRGVSRSDVVLEYSFDGWYQGQSRDLRATLAREMLEGDDLLVQMRESFDDRHDAMRGFSLPDTPIRLLQARVTGFSASDTTLLEESELTDDEATEAGTREIVIDGERVSVPYYYDEDLCPGQEVSGPSVIHSDTFTIKLNGGQECRLDKWQNYRIQT